MTAEQNGNQAPLVRWYIDTRPLTSANAPLPLIETLQPPDQESVKRYYHLKDRHMSLASNLLKYLFIHRTCRIPWDKITINRTPPPHHRPCFIPTADHHAAAAASPLPNIEFNVSHQASLVALAGTTLPTPNTPPPAAVFTPPNPSNTPAPTIPQVGIDITCVNERRSSKTPAPNTRKALADFVDIFAEVFSARELDAIKSLRGVPPQRSDDDSLAVECGYRLFYTYWALKEAYIKMTGEALLAPWLRELEFTDVVAVEPEVGGGQFSAPYTGIQTWLYRRKVGDVRIEVVAFEEDYLIATAARGGEIGNGSGDSWRPLEKIDIEGDVRPCAMGTCSCLG